MYFVSKTTHTSVVETIDVVNCILLHINQFETCFRDHIGNTIFITTTLSINRENTAVNTLGSNIKVLTKFPNIV